MRIDKIKPIPKYIVELMCEKYKILYTDEYGFIIERKQTEKALQ